MGAYVLAVEGESTVDGRLIRPGALTWETPMPVFAPRTDDDPWNSPAIGTIESIRRVENESGSSFLLATIAWNEDPLPLHDLGLCAQVDSVEADYELDDDNRMILKGGRIRGAFIGTPAWPATKLGGD